MKLTDEIYQDGISKSKSDSKMTEIGEKQSSWLENNKSGYKTITPNERSFSES